MMVLIISNVHQVFYSEIRPKKSRGKGSQGKKTTDGSQETVDVSEESEPEPEPTTKAVLYLVRGVQQQVYGNRWLVCADLGQCSGVQVKLLTAMIVGKLL
ncbi:hypothetical protein Tco_0847160 [Tanacetum coccineum]